MRDHLIEALRQANPVPSGSVPADDRLMGEEVIRSTFERRRQMVSTKPTVSSPVERRGRAWLPQLAASLGAIALVAGLGTVLVSRDGGVASDPARGDTPVAQMEIVRDVVDAINARDYDALRSSFGPDGEVTTPIQFELSNDSYSIDAAEWMRAWLTVFETWGATSDLRSCVPETDTLVRCRVVTSFKGLFMELPADWAFVFGPGDLLQRLVIPNGQPDAVPQSQPLNWYGVMDGWTAWLQDTQPDQAERLLPRAVTGEGEGGYEIDGVQVVGGMIVFDPALAPEITASIEEYLATR